MFDTPDLRSFCLAPFVGIAVAALVYMLARPLSKKHSDIPLLLAFLILPTACLISAGLRIGEFDPAPWFAPTERDVVGKWELHSSTLETLEEFYEFPVPPHELAFEADGTFSISNAPSFWSVYDEEEKKWMPSYMTGEGTWSFAQVEGTQRLETVIVLKFETLNGVDVADMGDRTISMYFSGHLPPYNLRTLNTQMLTFSFRRQ